MTYGAVGSFLVVDRNPLLVGGTSLINTFELTGINHLDTERADKPFEVGVLCRSTGLSELPVDSDGLGPRLHDVCAPPDRAARSCSQQVAGCRRRRSHLLS